MNNKFIIKVVVAIVLILVIFALRGNLTKQEKIKTELETTQTTKEAQAIITVTSSGFNPANTTIKPNTRIIWINKTNGNVTVNSAEYPTNKLHPFLNLGEFASSSSVQAVFTKNGTYKYHNYLNPKQTGMVVVE
ncbi:hypothetical protein KKG52_03680 [Patescibacteria group bacterium]|nr:hypothetical protein [Patescibacteria group bacterium]